MVSHVKEVETSAPGVTRLIIEIGAIFSLLTGALVWAGGLSPGMRAEKAEATLTSRLDAHQKENDAWEMSQSERTAQLQNDLLIVLTLKCSDQSVSIIRAKGQYAAAARCESLVKTGR